MANLTRTQIKNKLKKLNEQLADIRLELEELQDDIDYECNEIEPYEGKDELTPAQEERLDWLDEAVSTLDTVIYNVQDAEDEIDNLI